MEEATNESAIAAAIPRAAARDTECLRLRLRVGVEVRAGVHGEQPYAEARRRMTGMFGRG